jgi:hypothetical protein
MKPPKNIDAQSMAVVGMALLLLGGARDPWMQYLAFGILVVGVVLMAYMYRKVVSKVCLEDPKATVHEGSELSPDKENKKPNKAEMATPRKPFD